MERRFPFVFPTKRDQVRDLNSTVEFLVWLWESEQFVTLLYAAAF